MAHMVLTLLKGLGLFGLPDSYSDGEPVLDKAVMMNRGKKNKVNSDS